MELYLVRHAIAFDADPARWPDDRDRPLTRQGEKKFRKAARGLEQLVPRVDLLPSSPLARAWRTAELLQVKAGWPEPSRCDALEPGRPPGEVVDALQPHSNARSVALVGHEPSLHELLSYLLTGDPHTVRVSMKKGGVACLELQDGIRAGSAVVEWLLPPGAMRAIDT
jgi:phosphohistidine phosphatase